MNGRYDWKIPLPRKSLVKKIKKRAAQLKTEDEIIMEALFVKRVEISPKMEYVRHFMYNTLLERIDEI